jgi:hypothetical protein
VLFLPGNIFVNAPDPTGAVVDYFASGSDYPNPPPTVTCNPPSGTKFPIGTTQVSCEAIDGGDNHTTGRFYIIIYPPLHTLTTLEPVHVWLGLKNSDDQGTAFDVMVELTINDTTWASGLTRCVTGLKRTPSLATEVIVPWNNFNPVDLNPGDTLAIRVSTRIGTNNDGSKCSGAGASHNSAVGVRLYYDATSRDSHLGATINPDPGFNLSLRSDGGACGNSESAGVTSRVLDHNAPTSSAAKCKDSASVTYSGGNAFKPVGQWSFVPLT